MSAKEMFENLGYKKIQDNDDFVMYFENGKKIVRKQIIFCIENKVVELTPKLNDRKHYFTRVNMEELKAIIQQCKEFGWYE